MEDRCEFFSVEAELNPGSIQQWLSVVRDGPKGTRRSSDISMKVKKHLSALGWGFAYIHRGKKKRELRYKSPKGRWFYSLATACLSCVDDDDDDDDRQQRTLPPKVVLSASVKTVPNVEVSKKKRKTVRGCDINGTTLNEENRSSDLIKIVPNVDVPKAKKRKMVRGCDINGTSLNGENRSSDLVKIVPNVDVPKKKQVEDCSTAAFNGETRKDGEKNRSSDLIKIVLNLDVINQQRNKKTTRMVTDAAFISSTPSEDKGEIRPRFEKSLRKILQVMEKKNNKCERESVRFWRKDCGPENNCDVCCVCHWGGDLLLCDGCPSAFHHTCLGFTSLPEEELWFCPCCCCDICGSMETSGNSKLMTCEQCQRRFHLKCLKQEPCLVSCRGWFCSSQCSRVFSALQSLLGRKIAVGDEDLVWTLMRAPNDGEHYDDEQISKLGSAVEILHQGFEPTKDPFSGRDLVEELVFRKDATGVGRGFYTVLIERNNEPITAAAVRVDKDVAEIPLVATLSEYRRSGMCRVLMDELEKQMSKMGVYRLVLPAAAEVVTTWTQRFGFSVMESSERLEIVKHGMLDFVGTVMCHKFLMQRAGSRESSLTE